MDSTLHGQVRRWYGRSSKAKRAYGWLRNDATTIAGGIMVAAREVRFVVGCIVDPPSKSPKRPR